MQFKAVVKYRGWLAHYLISNDVEGIYLARLARYDGRPETRPPKDITLIKGEDKWNTNCIERGLLHDVVKIIKARTGKTQNAH